MKKNVCKQLKAMVAALLCVCLMATPVCAETNAMGGSESKVSVIQNTADNASASSVTKAKKAYANYLNSHRSTAKYFRIVTLNGSSIPVLITASSVKKVSGKYAASSYKIYLYKNGAVTKLQTFANNGSSSYLTLANKYLGATYRMGIKVLSIRSGYLAGKVVYYYRFSGHEGYYYKYYSHYTEKTFEKNLTWSKMTKIPYSKASSITDPFYNNMSQHIVSFTKNTATNVKNKC